MDTPEKPSLFSKAKKTFTRTAAGILFLLGILALFFLLRPDGEFAPRLDGLKDQEPAMTIKALTWNIRTSEKHALGPPSWSERKKSFREILGTLDMDILCLQEALPKQIQDFAEWLPGYGHYAVGRDDGAIQGEHCPIFYNSQKFQCLQSGTFWLSETPDVPSKGWGEGYPRICSWVELKENTTGRHFRVYNVHLQLLPNAQRHGAQLLANRIQSNHTPSILAGDMNCPPEWKPIQILQTAGLEPVETSGALTFHINGKGLRCLDQILTSRHWGVSTGGILKQKGSGGYPSDHFGLWTELRLY